MANHQTTLPRRRLKASTAKAVATSQLQQYNTNSAQSWKHTPNNAGPIPLASKPVVTTVSRATSQRDHHNCNLPGCGGKVLGATSLHAVPQERSPGTKQLSVLDYHHSVSYHVNEPCRQVLGDTTYLHPIDVPVTYGCPPATTSTKGPELCTCLLASTSPIQQ